MLPGNNLALLSHAVGNDGRDAIRAHGRAESQVSQDSRSNMVYRSMDLQPALLNGLLHRLVRRDDPRSGLNIQLGQSHGTLGVILDGGQLCLVGIPHGSQAREPGVEHAAELPAGESASATGTVGVAAKDDVLDFDVAHGELDDGHGVEIRGVDDVGDVAVHEGLARLQA